MFSENAKAQTDIPELILEETEYGYIIINWEDTRIEDDFPPQGEQQIPPIINPPPTSDQNEVSSSSSSVDKKMDVKVNNSP